MARETARILRTGWTIVCCPAAGWGTVLLAPVVYDDPGIGLSGALALAIGVPALLAAGGSVITGRSGLRAVGASVLASAICVVGGFAWLVYALSQADLN